MSRTAAEATAGRPAVEVRRSARRTRTVTAYRDRDTIVVLVPARMSAADERAFVDELVAKVLERERRAATRTSDDHLLARAHALADRYLSPEAGRPVRATSVSWVSNQQRRWGSCSVQNRRIRLSDRMRTMPDWVVDYVLLHELTHLVHADHSERFWRLLAAYPQAERARGYLEGWHAAQGTAPTEDC